MWLSLAKQYKHLGFSQVTELTIKLIELKLSSRSDIDRYTSEFVTTLRQLADMGEIFPHSIAVPVFLHNLGDYFRD